MEGHERDREFNIFIDLSRLEEYVIDKSILERFYNSKSSADNFTAIP